MSVVEGIDVPSEGVLADGTPVKAKCRYRAKDISVELLSPYPGQHAGRHIMFMSPRQLKDGRVDKRTYQLGIAPINKAIRDLKLIAFEQEESNGAPSWREISWSEHKGKSRRV